MDAIIFIQKAFAFIMANYQMILSSLVMILSGIIAIAMIIPGDQPEKALQKIVDAITKFSKK